MRFNHCIARCAISCCAATVAVPLTACSFRSDGSGSASFTPSREVVRLRAAYAGLIETGDTGSAYAEYVSQMENLLNEWDPVGASVEELVFLLGVPSELHEDRIVYIFDGGFSGVLWVFHVENDRITSVERGSIN